MSQVLPCGDVFLKLLELYRYDQWGITYFGIIIGAILGGIVSWWIYNRQKKISNEQDNLLSHIEDLEENNKLILQRAEYYQEKHEKLFKEPSLIREKEWCSFRK